MRHHFTIGLYLMTLVTLVDQFSKWWVLTMLNLDFLKKIEITSFFNLVLSWNKGITFGLFNQHSEWIPYVLIAAAVVIVLLLLFWLARAKTLPEALGLGFMMGGAIGNVADRIRYGAVVDFLDFHVAGYHWYAFNLADSAIVAGVAFLLFDNLVEELKKK